MLEKFAAGAGRMLASALAILTLWQAIPAMAAVPPPTFAAPQPRSAVVIAYRSSIGNRPLLRQEVLQDLVPRLEGWRRDGTIAGYQLLCSSFVDAQTWDLLAILTFRDFAGIDRWRNIERSSPGGLTARELQFLAPSSEYLMDVVQRSRSAQGSGKPGVFLVIPYVFSPTPLERYLQYAQGYIVPETEGWMRHGNISSYGLYVNRFYPDEPVQSLLVLEYKDFAALANREAVVTQTRKELSADPAWKSWSDAKDHEHIRAEKRAVIAELLAAH
ncbi:MAG TPA: hypothetical protein VGR92_20015 [Steroidobacteraceae bacterium]|nr:hypothetical protein [Steroidobacteraceae bacterium]